MTSISPGKPNLSALNIETLRKFKRHYKLTYDDTREKLELAVSRHFKSLRLDDQKVLTRLVSEVRRRKSTPAAPPPSLPTAAVMTNPPPAAAPVPSTAKGPVLSALARPHAVSLPLPSHTDPRVNPGLPLSTPHAIYPPNHHDQQQQLQAMAPSHPYHPYSSQLAPVPSAKAQQTPAAEIAVTPVPAALTPVSKTLLLPALIAPEAVLVHAKMIVPAILIDSQELCDFSEIEKYFQSNSG